jgi:hypothetical protein
MDSRIIVLGLGADPRIYGEPVSYAKPSPVVEESVVLTYREQPSAPDPMLFVLELLFEGGLEVLFGLVEFLL